MLATFNNTTIRSIAFVLSGGSMRGVIDTSALTSEIKARGYGRATERNVIANLRWLDEHCAVVSETDGYFSFAGTNVNRAVLAAGVGCHTAQNMAAFCLGKAPTVRQVASFAKAADLAVEAGLLANVDGSYVVAAKHAQSLASAARAAKAAAKAAASSTVGNKASADDKADDKADDSADDSAAASA